MQPHEANHRLAELAADHHGVITTSMAATVGVSSAALLRRARSGALERVDEQVYRVAGAPATWSQRALLACHVAGPDAVLSHRAAASVWRLDGFERAPIELTVDRWTRRERRPNTIVHESTDLAAHDQRVVSGLPITSAVRTIIDVAAVAHSYRIEQALEDALRRRLCTAPQLAQRFTQIAGRGKPGVRRLRPLLEARVGEQVPTHSMLERRVADLVDRLPVTAPVRQHPVVLPATTVYLDFAWPERMIALEADGLYDHATNLQLPWDDDRQTELVLLGWHVLRVSWQMVTQHPSVVADQIRRAHARFA